MSVTLFTSVHPTNQESSSKKRNQLLISPRRLHVAEALVNLGNRTPLRAIFKQPNQKIRRVIGDTVSGNGDKKVKRVTFATWNILHPISPRKKHIEQKSDQNIENFTTKDAIVQPILPQVVEAPTTWGIEDVVIVQPNCSVHADLSSKEEETIIGIRDLGNNIAIVAMGFRFSRTYELKRPRVNGLAIVDGTNRTVTEGVENLKREMFEVYHSPKKEHIFVVLGPSALLEQHMVEIRRARMNDMPANNIIALPIIDGEQIDLVIEKDTINYGHQIIVGL